MTIVIPTTVKNNEDIVINDVFTDNAEHISSFPLYSPTAYNYQGSMRVYGSNLYRCLSDCVDRQPDLYVGDFWSDFGTWDNVTCNAWEPATSYPAGYVVSHSLGYKHYLYISNVASNLGNKPSADDGTNWTNIGAVNLYRCLYDKTNNKTERAEDVWLELDSSVSDTVAIIGASGVTATITQYLSDGTITRGPTTYDLQRKGATSASEFLYNPFSTRTTIWQNILSWGNTSVKVDVSKPSGIAAIGRVIVGKSKYIGATLSGVGAGIIDFSRKERDEDFGDVYLQQRTYAGRADFVVKVATERADEVYDFLTSIRGREALMIGDDRDATTEAFDMLTIYGFVRDWNIMLESKTYSEINIEWEGLI